MRRVVVTGLGCATPLGGNMNSTWSRLIKGESGIKYLDGEEFHGLSSRVAGVVPLGEGTNEFSVSKAVGREGRSSDCKFIAFALGATEEAMRDAGFDSSTFTEEQRERMGVCIGSGIGSISDIVQAASHLSSGEKGFRKISPFFIPRILVNMAGGQVSIKYGLKGPNHAVSTACATGSHAISDAYRFIKYGDADVMVAGGSESSVNQISLAGFSRLRALCTSFNDKPTEASRPFDKHRDGFVMGEGCGVVILEEYSHARKRGAKIYAEVRGVGYSGDGFHMTSPSEDGSGAVRAMKAALRDAKMTTNDISYINAHATSTPVGDVIEARAINRLFLSDPSLSHSLAVSSTKGAIGHLLGAAGAVESIFCIKAIETNIVPPTVNLHEVDEELRNINFVPLTCQRMEVKAALSNSFGFGGTNSSIIFSKVDDASWESE